MRLLLAFLVAAAQYGCANDDRSLLVGGGEAIADGAAAGSMNETAAGSCPDLDDNGVPDCTETLVANAAFNFDDSHWQSDQNIVQRWSGTDGNQSRGSGSVRVENSQAATVPTLAIGGTSQCIPVSGGALIDSSVQLALAGSAGTESTAGLETRCYSSADCSGDVLQNRGASSVLSSSEWRSIGLSEQAPPSARSLQVRLVAIRPFSDPPLAVLFDNVLVRTH